MSTKNTKLSKVEIQKIIAERLNERRMNRKIMEGHKQLAAEGKDFYSDIVRALAEEIAGESYNPEMIDEGFMGGLWDKAKNMVSFGKAADSDKLRAALEKGGNAAAAKVIDDVEETAPNFPNTKSQEAFDGGLAKILGLYKAITDATKLSPQEEGFMNADAANAVIDALKEYLADAESKLSRVYKYMREEDETGEDEDLLEGEDEDEQLDERLVTNFNRMHRLMNLMKKGEASPKQMKKLKKVYNGLEKEFAKRGGTKGMTPKEQSLLGSMSKHQKAINTGDQSLVGGAAAAAAPTPAAAAEPRIRRTRRQDPEPTPEPTPDPEADLDPGETDRFGNYSDPGPDADLDPGETDSFDNFSDPGPEGDMDPGGDFGSSAVDPGEAGAGGGGMLDSAAGALGVTPSTLMYMGIGGAALGAATYAAYRFLKAKRKQGWSREGEMQTVVKQLQPVAAAPAGGGDPGVAVSDAGEDQATVKMGTPGTPGAEPEGIVQHSGGGPAATAGGETGAETAATVAQPELGPGPTDQTPGAFTGDTDTGEEEDEQVAAQAAASRGGAARNRMRGRREESTQAPKGKDLLSENATVKRWHVLAGIGVIKG